MAVTKILPRSGGLKAAIQYVLNGEKTRDQVLTAHLNCDPGYEYQEMMDTKRRVGKTGGRQCYHLIQSFAPGEVTAELALEIATAFAEEHLPGYETVIGVHTDKNHIHAHILFNSVNADTGKMYHISNKGYYEQIREVSDRLCREHGLSVIVKGETGRPASYVEWLRQQKGEPTFRSMLEADIRTAIEDANDLGHFYLLMEHQGYEIFHGKRLGFRLRGQERFLYPERKNRLFTEDNIRAAIDGNMEAIEAGLRPVTVYRPPYVPFRPHPKYTGFLALYVHYLYVLGKIEKREYPPRMTPHMKREIMKFERYREQFAFLREHDITDAEGLEAYRAKAEDAMASLTKQRTILNVRKKRQRELFDALADEEILAPLAEAYEQGLTGFQTEYARLRKAVELMDACGIPREALTQQKAALYADLAEVNRKIHAARKQLELCIEIQNQTPRMERDLQAMEPKKKGRQRDLEKTA